MAPAKDSRLEMTLGLFEPPPGTKLWHGGASVLGALRGVKPEEAAWKPAPDRHSIWDLTLHVAYYNYVIWRRMTGAAEGGFPRSPSCTTCSQATGPIASTRAHPQKCGASSARRCRSGRVVLSRGPPGAPGEGGLPISRQRSFAAFDVSSRIACANASRVTSMPS